MAAGTRPAKRPRRHHRLDGHHRATPQPATLAPRAREIRQRREQRAHAPNPPSTLAMGYEHQMPFHCIADGDLPAFLPRMIGVRKGGRERIEEHRSRVFKSYAMLRELGRRLAGSRSLG